MPAQIEALEKEQGEIAARLAEPATYQGDPAEVRTLTERTAQIEQALLAAMERWDVLETRQRTLGGG